MNDHLKIENSPAHPKRETGPLWVCICGMLVNLIAYYPGFLSSDSLNQFEQAITGNFSDWHPPAMAMLWRILCYIYQGPQLMFLLQIVFLWASGYLLLRSIHSRAWNVCIIIFLLSPFVQNFSGYIIKDSQMALSWLLATSMIFYYSMQKKQPNKIAILFAALLIAYGTWVRTNSATGCLPVCFFWAYCMLGKRTGISRLVWSVTLFSFILAGQFILIPWIAKPTRQHVETKLQMQDLSGIFVKTHQNVFPASLFQHSGFDTGYIRKKYQPATFDDIWWSTADITSTGNKRIQVADNQIADVNSAWRKALLNFPGTYIENRWQGFLYYLRIKTRGAPLMTYFVWIDENNTHHLSYKRNFISDAFIMPLEWQQNMPYMRPWFWFLLNIGLFPFVSAIPQGPARMCYVTLLTSGLLYQLPSFFFFQTDTDFRYFYWNCIACSVALALLIASNVKKKRTMHSPNHTP